MAKRSYPTSEVRGRSPEELPRVRGQGWQPRAPGCDSAGAAEKSYPRSEVRGGSQEELPHTRYQRQRREEQPHVQGVVAARAPEGLEELFHIQSREGRW